MTGTSVEFSLVCRVSVFYVYIYIHMYIPSFEHGWLAVASCEVGGLVGWARCGGRRPDSIGDRVPGGQSQPDYLLTGGSYQSPSWWVRLWAYSLGRLLGGWVGRYFQTVVGIAVDEHAAFQRRHSELHI